MCFSHAQRTHYTFRDRVGGIPKTQFLGNLYRYDCGITHIFMNTITN
jgi:hypothetical protein